MTHSCAYCHANRAKSGMVFSGKFRAWFCSVFCIARYGDPR